MRLGRLLRHTHAEATGEIKLLYHPWTEDTYVLGAWLVLVHWQQLRKHPLSPRLQGDPRHTWRIYFKGTTLRLVVQWGIAPE